MENIKYEQQELVIRLVCEAFNVTDAQLKGPSRKMPIPDARKAVYHLLHNEESKKFIVNQTAARLNRIHSTVCVGAKEALVFYQADKYFKASIDEIKRQLALSKIDFTSIPQY